MKKIGDWFEQLFRFFASLKLAVIVIVMIGVISAIGTIVESQYDANYAQKIVYHSPYMYFALALLCVNLINVMVDRLPWKPHHAGFICAHIGIILVIVGSLVTKLYGLDGSMAIDIGGRSRFVMIPDQEFAIYSSFGTGGWEPIQRMRADFLVNPPDPEKNKFKLGDKEGYLKEYYHYAQVDQKLVSSSDPQDGPALRVQLQNANVNMTEWLIHDRKQPQTALELGPAKVIMTELEYKHESGNAIVLKPVPNSEELYYEIYTASKGGLTKKGKAAAGDVIETGWMALQMRLLKYMPQAKQELTFKKLEKPLGENTTSALLMNFDGKDYWIALNSNVRVFTDTNVFLFSFANQRVDIGFDMHLKEFNIGRYQGTMRAASYSSDVYGEGFGDHHISMNEPLKFSGLTFYQASYNENAQGQVTQSILSVNKDPGRFLKYLGSALIVLGTIIMFYFKRYRMKIFSTLESKEGAS
jgi:hypothetical protein